MRVLFVEPFYGGSHRAFLDGLVRHSRHEFRLLTLPEGEWRRRMRLGAQELAAPAGGLDGPFDLLIATDMLDLPAFLALTRPRFAHVPVMVYFHENQLTYPRVRGTKLNSWFGAMNYLSAAAADRVAFNSEFHRRDFLGALRTLSGQPQNWLLPATIDAIEAKSDVLPVGVELDWLDDAGRPGPARTDGAPIVLWNHRWEFDKAPDVFVRAILRLHDEGLPFRVAVAGEQGPNPHPALSDLPGRLGDRLIQFGPLDRAGYEALLCESDVVVSTTRHEFFGVGMVEAMYAGCFPIVPDGFNYPALVPAGLHARSLWRNEEEFLALLRAAIVAAPHADAESLRQSAARFAWPLVAAQWDSAIDAAAGAGSDAQSR